MFAFGIALLGLIQTTLIPSANEDVEIEHSQTVRGQIQDLRNDIVRSASSGANLAQGVKLGTDYPTRVFFLNPPPAAGSINTEGTTDPDVELAFENVEATNPETQDYWDTSPRFGTGAVVYRPGYNAFEDAPNAVVIENSIAYSEFDSNTLISANQRLIDGREISLTAIDGQVSDSSAAQATIDTTAVSPAETTVPVTDTGSGINITITTRLSEQTLVRDVFAPQIDDSANGSPGLEEVDETCSDIAPDPSNDNDRFIQACDFGSAPGEFNSFTLTMEPDTTYNLKLAKVGVGTGASNEGSHYITKIGGSGGSLVDNAARELTFEVRDRYNNPVSGVEVELSAPDDSGDELTADGNTGNSITATTDENGRVTAVYDPNDVPDDSTETRRIVAETDTDGDGDTDLDIEQAEYNIDIVDAESDANVGSSINPSGPIILGDSRVAAEQTGGGGMGGGSLDCTDNNAECLVKVDLSHTNPPSATTWEIKNLRYHFYIAPLSPGASTRESPPQEVVIYDDDGSTPCNSDTYIYQNNFQSTSFGDISPGDTETLVLDFNQGSGNFKSVQGDGAILTITFEEQGNPGNTFSASYFLSPVQDTTYDSGCA